jgi:hypothetical protein
MNSSSDYLTLRENLSTGNVAAFVGAGLSVWVTGTALIDAAQAYINREGLHSLLSFIKRRLDTTGKSLSAAHRALAQLPISLIFTANYDDLLERAYRDAGKRIQVVVRDNSIPYMLRW